MSDADLIKKLAADIGIKEVVIDTEPTKNCPAEFQYGVDIGECPFSWHFYGATAEAAQAQALAWLRKPKGGCVCHW